MIEVIRLIKEVQCAGNKLVAEWAAARADRQRAIGGGGTGVLSTMQTVSHGEGVKITAVKEATGWAIVAPGLCHVLGSRLRTVGGEPNISHPERASDVSQIARI